MGFAFNLKPSSPITKYGHEQRLNVNEYWQSVGVQITIIPVWVPETFHIYATRITVMEQYRVDCCVCGCVLQVTK